MVQPILAARCSLCHSFVNNETQFLVFRTQAANRVESRNMPMAGSAQALAMTDEERFAVIRYCNGE